MKIQLKGIELELPDGAKVDISDDGSKIKIGGLPTGEPEVIEKIRIVEVAGPETIRYIPNPIYTAPYNPHNPFSPQWPSGPNWIYTGTTTGGSQAPVTTVPFIAGTSTITTTGNTSFMLSNFQTDFNPNDADASGCVAVN